MKKNDIILISSFCIIAIIIFVILYATKSKGETAYITINGKEYKRISTSEDNELRIETEYGYNTVVVKSGEVYVESADCDNHSCMHQGKIKNSGETIVCLPHKLIITIE